MLIRTKRNVNNDEEECKYGGKRGTLIKRKRNVNKQEEECK